MQRRCVNIGVGFILLLGVIQGIAEFLPVSSSGHLALFQIFTGIGARGGEITAVNVLLHVGTLAAVLIVYRKEVVRLIPAFFTLARGFLTGKRRRLADCTPDERTVLLLAVATLPLCAVKVADASAQALTGRGLLDAAEALVVRRPVVIGALLIFNGALLLIGDKTDAPARGLERFRARGALAVGIFQAFALLPGLSRSGMTITAARLCGLDREDALRFSFLLSIPAILGSLAVKIPDLTGGAFAAKDLRALLAAAALAFVTGLFCLALLRRAAKRASFRPFGFYSLAAGAAAIALGMAGFSIAA